MNFTEKGKSLIDVINNKTQELYQLILDKVKELNEVVFNEDFIDTYSIHYDGGNHPEYASNCFSILERVYMEDGKCFVDCEDGTMYFADLDYSSLISVYDFICAYEETLN